ncbi:LOW QUALITY PROTEIN: solute carrier family 12 member 3-like [Paramacrobiotus metropolitanus]|uniref:LOW QUALITY PROTEIN: solute carrier family 12 member 3-like n=1 Tax=Paramacrobiotus metropolitanus TaxID=2943436 RepID=UPI002445AC2E|nr:LOW QUALITY PROTEIN: solute carrier family 12 member 3-like [Paramacrobiotus metropolitanus]
MADRAAEEHATPVRKVSTAVQRKISSTVNILRDRVHVGFENGFGTGRTRLEGEDPALIGSSQDAGAPENLPSGSDGQPGPLVGRPLSRSPTAEDIELDISMRVEELQKEGISNPAFEKSQDDEEYPEEAANTVSRMSTDTGRKRRINRHADRFRKISLGYGVNEAVPSAEHYQTENLDRLRPTLDDLRTEKAAREEDDVRQTGAETKLTKNKLGWIRGVVLWTILNLWGVMLFLRIGWMCAQAGMGLFLVIVVIATIIAVLTSLSTSAISTNGEVGTGGTYFMISRSLGPQFGAAIGVIFTLANTINVSLNIQGFADVFVKLIESAGAHITRSGDPDLQHLNDVRVIAVITLILLTGFTFFGMEIASKLQSVFFVILMAAIFNIVIGSIVPPTAENQANGFVGYSSALFAENFAPAFQHDSTGDNSFMTVFGVFFPSVTGILAGTSITGDLRDPANAIPKGTIVAICFTSVSYILLGWVTAAVTLRHASGNVSDLYAGTLQNCMANSSCTQGSINNFEIMEEVAHFRPIVLAGIFSATLSTSLGCINFAPKIFQALCRDKIFPGIHIFGKGYGKNDEPYRAYGLVMIVAVIFLMPANLNFISNIVSNCFLLTYALVNYATFDAAFSKSPGWRPTFRYYNKWLSLVTSIACIVIMFALDWMSAIIAIGVAVILWVFVYYRDPKVNWGTSGEANIYRRALTDALKLITVEDHVKNYRPQILLLCGLPCSRPALVHFANSITKGVGMLICGHVLVGKTLERREVLAREIYIWLRRQKIRAFYDYVAAERTVEGMKALIQTSGLGKLKPNIIMMGYQQSWSGWTEESINSYIGVINHAFDYNIAVAILYAKEGFDIGEVVNFEKLVRENVENLKMEENVNVFVKNEKAVPLDILPTDDPDMVARINLARKFEPGKKKRMNGEIHVWWLYDDGGLTLLLPYLMTRRSPWSGCPLKVFCLAGADPESTKKSMMTLLAQFRIKAVDVVPVNLDQTPSLQSQDWFNTLISDYRLNEVTRRVSRLDHYDESEMVQFSRRTMNQIRLRELLLEHSSQSALNVITMPLPKEGRNSLHYMVVLDTLTRNMPLTLLIRGTQESVLTYYC